MCIRDSKEEGVARCARVGRRPHRCGCFSLFLVCGVVFYVSARLCGLCGAACVLDDVRRKAQAGQRTRKARSQVLPCKPRYSAYACLRKDLQEKSTFPKKDLIFTSFGYNFSIFLLKNA